METVIQINSWYINGEVDVHCNINKKIITYNNGPEFSKIDRVAKQVIKSISQKVVEKLKLSSSEELVIFTYKAELGKSSNEYMISVDYNNSILEKLKKDNAFMKDILDEIDKFGEGFMFKILDKMEFLSIQNEKLLITKVLQ